MESTLEKKTVTILVNDKSVEFETDIVTGSQIKNKAGVPADSTLFELRDGKRIPIGDNEQVKIHERERFLDVPGGTVS